ncbi:MAG: hypothetical protein ACFCUM_07620 [Bacteroidales bacterium]
MALPALPAPDFTPQLPDSLLPSNIKKEGNCPDSYSPLSIINWY